MDCLFYFLAGFLVTFGIIAAIAAAWGVLYAVSYVIGAMFPAQIVPSINDMISNDGEDMSDDEFGQKMLDNVEVYGQEKKE